MTRRRRKKSNAKHSFKWFSTLAIIIIANVHVIACREYNNRGGVPASYTEHSSTERSAPAQQGPGPLEHVDIPDFLTSQILEYPGFTVSFNRDYHQPNYVAWELTGDEVRANLVKRSNNFQPDLRVEGCPSLDDYRNSGYDRGHMAPAGDMKWSRDAMESCFYLTNMSPQHNALNSGAWNKLEEKCRDWAIRDSAIVIVCGPVLSDNMTLYLNGGEVPVPERYFKVVLAPYTDPPRGIGFIMPNGNVPGGMQATAVSIDEVEAITGFDFFAALPDELEDQLEAQCNFAKWTKR